MTDPINIEAARCAGWGSVTIDVDGKQIIRPECIVLRAEGQHRCSDCSRLHPFALSRVFPAEGRREIGDGLLVDSWEDAAHQLREWMPDDGDFGIWRESATGAVEYGPPATDRESAIRYLLAPPRGGEK